MRARSRSACMWLLGKYRKRQHTPAARPRLVLRASPQPQLHGFCNRTLRTTEGIDDERRVVAIVPQRKCPLESGDMQGKLLSQHDRCKHLTGHLTAVRARIPTKRYIVSEQPAHHHLIIHSPISLDPRRLKVPRTNIQLAQVQVISDFIVF
jgi:hypothetical protein